MPRFDQSLFVLSPRSLACLGVSTLSLLSGSADATWSILIADMKTGEIVIGSATCVELINLQQETPVLISGVGAVTAQSAVDTSGMNRQLIRDRLLQGVPLEMVLEELSMTDSGHNNRQYGMITASGQTLTYSGIQNAAWAGGQTGRIERGVPGPQDDIVYAVQGNILSGSNVVQAAVDAIVASGGDLPQMLMEGMQAAKSAGGDGRCSCSNADPTGCGSPPPAPFKSADVGYMLGTRVGDIDAARAIYPIDGFVGDVATMDLDGDGFEEVIVGNRDTNELSIFKNAGLPGNPLSVLQIWQTVSAPASGVVSMGVGDFDNDGQPELAVAVANPPKLLIYEQDGKGGLDIAPGSFDLPGTPTDIAVGDMVLPGDDIAVSIADTQSVRFYGLEDAAYQFWGSLDLGFAPSSIAIAEFVGGGAPDLVVTDAGSNLVNLYEHGGELGFELPVSITTLAGPIGVQGADMDNDGNNEIVVLTGAGRAIQVFSDDNGSWSQWASIPIGGTGIGMGIGDMNGDGFPDVVSSVAATNRNLRLWISDGQGGFTQQSRTRAGFTASAIRLADMNNNGDLDIVVGNGDAEGLSVLDNPRGGELPQPGRFAEGTYFMSLNVPNQRRSDPDPVDQLQTLYNDWLLTREGRVDAVRSTVSGRSVIRTGLGSTLTIELRDLRGDLVGISDPAMVEVEPDNGLITLGAPVLVEPGVFELQVTAGATHGRSGIEVLAGEEGDRVALMPRFEVSVSTNIADFNADGNCSFYDVSAFIAAYLVESPDADFTGEGLWNFHDISLFISEYNACTGG